MPAFTPKEMIQKKRDRGHVVLKWFYMVLVLYEKHQDDVSYPPGISHLDLIIPLKPPFIGDFPATSDY